MKFILAEDIKHTLDERLYLVEDLNYTSFISQCNDLLDYIKKLLKNAGLDSDSNKDTETQKLKMKKASEKIATKTNDLIKVIENTKDIDIASGRFKDYKAAVEDLIKIIDPDYGTSSSDIFKLFKDIEDNLLTDTADFKLTKQPLLKNLQRIVPITSELSARFSTVTDDSTGEKYDTERQNKILQTTYADIYRLSQLKDTKYDATVASVFSPIIELLTTKMNDAEADNSKVLNFLMTCEAVNDEKSGSLKTAMKSNSNLFKNTGDDDILNSLGDGQDWGKRYASAQDKAVVWQAYLKTVWKEYADDVNALGEPFRQECEKLGFNGASNPFIAFLEEYLVKKHYPIDRTHYFAIHNAVVNGYLKRTDLVSPKDPVTKANNIIFWEDFYLKGSPANYLELFGSMCDPTFNFDNFRKVVVDEAPTANKKLFAALGKWLDDTTKTKADFIYMVMSSANSLNDLLNTDGYTIKSPTQNLRSAAEISQLLNALSIDVTKKKAFSTSNVDTLVTILEKPPYIDNIKVLAPKIIRRLADAAGSDSASIRAYDALATKYPKIKRSSAIYSWDEGQAILKLVSEIGGDIEWDILNRIAKKFSEKGWFDD